MKMVGYEGDSRYVVISTDGHCGAALRDYKPYLEKRYQAEFDAWADTYHDAWGELDHRRPASSRVGFSSFEASVNWDSAERLAVSEADGLAAEVLFPNTSPPFFPSGAISAPGPRDRQEYEYRFAGLRAHNRWLVDFCNEVPGRRAGFAQVFLDDVDAAIAEVRWAKQNGLMGVLLPGDHVLTMANLYYPRYEPLWAECEALEMPVHRHGIVPCESSDIGGIGSPWVAQVEVTFYGNRAISHLICAGVFERYPALKFVTTETPNGAAIPGILSTLDTMYDPGGAKLRSYSWIAPAVEGLKRKPSEYFASNCYVAGPIDFRAARQAGTPNLMFGADLPHSEGTGPNTLEALRLCFADVPEQEVRVEVGERAAQVYGFDMELLQRVADRIGPSVDEVSRKLTSDEIPRDEDRIWIFNRSENLIGIS